MQQLKLSHISSLKLGIIAGGQLAKIIVLPASNWCIKTHIMDADEISFPFVRKIRKGGYDRRGVALVNRASETHKLLDVPFVIEQKLDIWKEISMIAARNIQGNVSHFP